MSPRQYKDLSATKSKFGAYHGEAAKKPIALVLWDSLSIRCDI